MRNRFLFRYSLTFLVFVFALSFTARIGYGEDFRNRNGAKAQIGEKAKLVEKKLPRIRAAIQAQNRHMERLMNIRGVVGTATGIGPDGEPEIRVLTEKEGIHGIPKGLDNFRVQTKVTGKFYALQDPFLPAPDERWPRPVPIGVSTGHPLITAGTIGARVRDAAGNVYALSNNHVYANINNANLGDSALQPGPFDGGTDPGDMIGTLDAYEPIIFSNYWSCALLGRNCNTMDAAIALSSTDDLDYATPPDGYGSPNSAIHPAYGVPNVIGDVSEDMGLLLGESVQKYGRTTRRRFGTVDSINAVVNVCYDPACQLVATFVDQLIITPATFSGGGDSGSLIVTNDANKYPVGLLFAGSDTDTIANPIDWALIRFGVDIDSGPTLPSLTINDVAVNEGDSGTTDAMFTVTLSEQSEEVVTVDYATSDGTATADDDYVFTSGPPPLTFPIGTTTQTITVPVSGDMEEEGDETFYVNLTSAIGATIVDGQGVGTIMDDDAPPDISINDVTVQEGSSGTTTDAVFAVSLSTSSSLDVTVQYATVDHTATAGSDYRAASGSLTFLAETTTPQLIYIPVIDDDEYEAEEVFYVDLFAAVNATIADNRGVGTILDDEPSPPSSGPHLQIGKVLGTTADWTTVSLDSDYYDYGDNMVVVCTPEYDANNLKLPLVAQVQNAQGTSFQVKLAPAVGSTGEIREATVHFMVVEEGDFDVSGLKMEAWKFESSVTDRKGSWLGEWRQYVQTYTNPVVVGQVMSYNCEDVGRCDCDTFVPGCYWTVFWSRGSRRGNPPSASALYVGKQVGEDPRAVGVETVGYIVIERGEGIFPSANGPIHYKADLGGDTIRGLDNHPPFSYSLSDLSFNPSTAILSQAGMDGTDGSWPVLFYPNPFESNLLRLFVDEDWAIDTERRHTTEQVGYIVFE